MSQPVHHTQRSSAAKIMCDYSRPNIRTLPVRRIRTSHSFSVVGGQLYEQKELLYLTGCPRLLFRASSCTYHQEYLAENETLRLAIGQSRGQR